MSEDQEMSTASPPRYLRDCLESTDQQDLYGPLKYTFVQAVVIHSHLPI